METIWFCIVAVMLAVYVLLDGFDLGAGMIHLFAARDDAERRAIIASIGPVWDGNEVWLLPPAAPLFRFPRPLCRRLQRLLSRSDDRALAPDAARSADRVAQSSREPLWRSFWDVVFCGSSVLLADLLRRGPRECGSRRPSRYGRILLRSALDQLPARREPRHHRLVHGARRRRGACSCSRCTERCG